MLQLIVGSLTYFLFWISTFLVTSLKPYCDITKNRDDAKNIMTSIKNIGYYIFVT